MTTITMPRELDSAIQQIADQAKTACVAALAEKFGFDAEEAHRHLGGDAQVKVVKKRGPVPKIKRSPKSSDSDEADKPKRRPTGYLLFSAATRPEVRAELEEALEEGVAKVAPQEVVRALGARWKALEADVRETWNQQALKHPDFPPPSTTEPASPKAASKAKPAASKKPKEPKTPKEPKEPKTPKEPKEPKKPRQPKEPKEPSPPLEAESETEESE